MLREELRLGGLVRSVATLVVSLRVSFTFYFVATVNAVCPNMVVCTLVSSSSIAASSSPP